MSFKYEIVRKARESLGITQAELADMVRTTQPTISRIERNGGPTKHPDKKLARRMAQALRVELAEIFVDDESSGVPDPITASAVHKVLNGVAKDDQPPRDDQPLRPLSDYEAAVIRNARPDVHTIETMQVVAEAIRRVLAVTKIRPDPDQMAQEWLEVAGTHSHGPLTPFDLISLMTLLRRPSLRP